METTNILTQAEAALDSILLHSKGVASRTTVLQTPLTIPCLPFNHRVKTILTNLCLSYGCRANDSNFVSTGGLVADGLPHPDELGEDGGRLRNLAAKCRGKERKNLTCAYRAYRGQKKLRGTKIPVIWGNFTRLEKPPVLFSRQSRLRDTIHGARKRACSPPRIRLPPICSRTNYHSSSLPFHQDLLAPRIASCFTLIENVVGPELIGLIVIVTSKRDSYQTKD